MRLLYPLLILLLFVSCNGFVEVELSNSSEGGKPLLSLTVSPTYSSFSNFLEYTQPDGLGCDPGTDTDCVHGGEKRQAQLTGYSSCLNITGSDSLGVFEWECDGSTNPVTIRIKDFNHSKGLADLIDGNTNSFKSIYLSVFKDSVEIARSSADQWWTNFIKELPENSGVTDFSLTLDTGTYTEGDILIFKSSRSSIGYIINMDKLAIVGMNGATMTWITNDPNRRNCSNSAEAVDNAFESLCLIASGTQNYIWIEGIYEADKNETNAQPNIWFYENKYSRVHNFTSAQCRGSCVFTRGDFNKVTDGTVGSSNDIGLNHGACNECLYEDILTRNNDNLGVLGFNGTNITLNRITGIENNGFIRIQSGNVGLKGFNLKGINNSGDCIYDPFGGNIFVNVFCNNNVTGGSSLRINATGTTIVNVFNINESGSAGTSGNGTSLDYSIINSGQLEVATDTTVVNTLAISA